jgi:hypothetical protein
MKHQISLFHHGHGPQVTEYQLSISRLKNDKFTLKHFVGTRTGRTNTYNLDRLNWEHVPASNEQYKSIPGMPIFDTFEQAKEYRAALTGSETNSFVLKTEIAARMRAVAEQDDMTVFWGANL